MKVEGKGTFLNSGNLKEFTREMVNRGYREFVVDLEKCAMMDSTFSMIPSIQCEERVVVGCIRRMPEIDSIFA